MAAHLRDLVNEAQRQVGGQPQLPARRARRILDGLDGVLPADVATVALASPLEVRAAIGLLLLAEGSLCSIVELSCEDIDSGSMVLLGNCWFDVPRFCGADLRTLTHGRDADAPLFPGRTEAGRMSAQGLRRAIERNAIRTLGFKVRPTDIKALGRVLRARCARGNRLPAAMLEMTTWDQFAQLRKPATPRRQVGTARAGLEVAGLRTAAQRLAQRVSSLEAQQEGLRAEAYAARARVHPIAQSTKQAAEDVRQLRRDLQGQRSSQLDLITDVARLQQHLPPGEVAAEEGGTKAPPGKQQPLDQGPRGARRPPGPEVGRSLPWGDMLRALMLLPDAAEALDSLAADDWPALMEEFIRTREMEEQGSAG